MRELPREPHDLGFTGGQHRRTFKQAWFRRAKNRGKYHELELIRKLQRAGWKGKRIPVSGPFLSWCDVIATRDSADLYRIGLFQLRPRKKSSAAWFNGKQALSLLMLESMYKPTFHGDAIQISKVLVAILRHAKVVYHQLTPEDLLHVGLTDSLLSRISLDDPVGATRIMQRMPSPIPVSARGNPLANFYDYLGAVGITLHADDQSNWSP